MVKKFEKFSEICDILTELYNLNCHFSFMRKLLGETFILHVEPESYEVARRRFPALFGAPNGAKFGDSVYLEVWQDKCAECGHRAHYSTPCGAFVNVMSQICGHVQ